MNAKADQQQLPATITCTVPQAAAILGISPNHYYALFARGEVPGRRLGRRVSVPVLQLKKYLDGEDWT